MADFTALKTAIQNAIKQNGNEEITGAILQEVMLAVVSTLGDSAINDLVAALSTEVTNRQNADGTLQSNLNAEQSARQLADSTLQSGINNERDLRVAADNALSNRITAITDAIDNGYVYAGIATTSTEPVTGKVFYLTTATGVFTNFGGITDNTKGIKILKKVGSTWTSDTVIVMDDTPTENSTNLVKSGGVYASITNVLSKIAEGYLYVGIATTSTNPSTSTTKVFYIATAAGTYTNFLDSSSQPLVLTQGINILKFNGASWSVEQVWGVDDEPIAGSDNLVKSGGVFNDIMTNGSAFDLTAYNNGTTYADLDAALTALNALPAAYKKGGMSLKFILTSDNKYVQCRLMADDWSTNTEDWAIADEGVYVENPEFIYVKTDAEGKILLAIKIDGSIYYGAGCPPQVKEYVSAQLAHYSDYDDIVTFLGDLIDENTLATLLGTKVDKVNGKSLIDTDIAANTKYIVDTVWLDTKIDDNNKILEGIKRDGTKVVNLPVAIPSAKFDSLVGIDWIKVVTDSLGHILEGITTSGKKKEMLDVEYLNGIPTQIKNYIDSKEETKNEVLTVLNSDKIGIVGDSFTESAYSIKNKSYIAKLSLFSDYQFVNFGQSGDIYAGRTNAIRNKAPRYGTIPYSTLKPRYTLMCSWINDVRYLTVNEYLDTLRTCIDTVIGIGSVPVVCTEFTMTNKAATKSGLQQVAKEYGLRYWDIEQIVSLIRGTDFASFWGDGHPGSRTNAIESDNYEKYLVNEIPRPQKSLKVFKARQSNLQDVSDYIFNTNYERAEKFYELSVGATDLSHNDEVDTVNTRTGVIRNESEYQLLINKSNVNLGKVGLISAVLPYINANIKYLALHLATQQNIEVYVKRALAAPYPSPIYYSAFYITFETEPQIGSVYKCTEDDTDYTVQGHIVDDLGHYHLFCTPYVANPAEVIGTLTKISGVGDNTLNYTYRERGINASSLVEDKGGNWVVLNEKEAGSKIYELGTDVDDAVDVDKIHFLIKSENDIVLTDVYLEYSGSDKKIVENTKPFKFITNKESQSTELLPSSTFGTAGVLDTNWNVTPINIYEAENGTNTYPIGCSSAVRVNDVTNLETIIDKSNLIDGIATLEIWARYFPDIYTDGSGNQITEESFDYNLLQISVGNELNRAILKDKVNTHWKVLQFPINTLSTSDLHIQLFSNSYGVEIAYVSLKY